MGLDKKKLSQPYLIGRATALVEAIIGVGNLPESFAQKVCTSPLGKLQYWLNKAMQEECVDNKYSELMEIADKVMPLPSFFISNDCSQFYTGYYHQRASIERNEIVSQIGNKIKDLRESLGLSQKELGEKTGLTQANIANIENGKYSMQIDTVNKLVKALGHKIEFVPDK